MPGGGGACRLPPGASQKSRKLRARAGPPGPCTPPLSCCRTWALCLVLPGEPEPPAPEWGCSQGGQRAPHWEQTSHPRPLHAHSLFGTPAAPGPLDQSSCCLAGCPASCICVVPHLCCFRNRLKILKNLTHQEVAAGIGQSGTGGLWCQQGLQDAGWLFSSFTHRYIPEG